jgi:hypothetical protein
MYTPKKAPRNLHLSFTDANNPTGTVSVSSGHFAVVLQPWSVSFNVSSDAGAFWSTGKQTFSWDETSAQWQNAHWETNNMIFSYDTVTVQDPFGGSLNVNEVAFTDPQDPTNSFQLTKSDFPAKYTSIMDGTISPDNVYMLTTISTPADVPAPISTRSSEAVTSVYPIQALWKFDNYGTQFTGAYEIPNSDKVYSVSGTGIIPDFVKSAPGGDKALFHSSLKPFSDPFSLDASVGTSALTVTGLLGLNPMQSAAAGESSTGYVDVVSRDANKDFHNIICYYMDDDIRETFVQNSPIHLDDSTVLAIATDSSNNQAFYKTLQVPYVVSSLARSTIDEAKQCNGERAGKQLNGIPADSDVYKRHSDLLYRYRFGEQFKIIKQYLDDQSQNDYIAKMNNAATSMKNQLALQSQGVNGPDPAKAAKLLADAQADVDSLCSGATDKKLFWAFQLFYWRQNFYLPLLYAESTSGTLSISTSMKLKALSSVFGILEGSAQNPNGKSFQEAFNDLVQMYQMSSIIPQFVDAGGNFSDFDSIMKAMLQKFADDNMNNSDPDIVKEAQNAKKLAGDDILRAISSVSTKVCGLVARLATGRTSSQNSEN